MSDPAKVKIVNLTLQALGQEPVTDLSDASLDGSVATVKILRVLDAAREAILARHGWLCALEYATLSPAAIPGYSNWRYPTVFLVPGGWLRVWEIDGETWCPELAGGWGTRWQVGTVEAGASARKVIRAAAGVWAAAGPVSSLNAAGVRLANWQALDVHVVQAIAYEAAAMSAVSVTGDKSLVAGLEKKREERVQAGINIDGMQEGGQPAAAPSIPAAIRARSR